MYKLLLVDDNNNNIRLLQDILEDEGYEVYTLNSGIPVLETSRKITPDLILLDIMMPEMDGLEVCQALKNDVELRNIPVIMVTAKSEGKDIKHALALGAVDYIKKPIDEDEVIARVQSALRQKKYREDLENKATRDSLTDLYNHAHLIEHLNREISKQKITKESLSFAMIDVDFFKKINDTYGHIAGDLVLKKVSLVLQNVSKENDISGRYGGEEFGLILVNTTREETKEICERIRMIVAENIINTGHNKISATISIGFYYKSADDDTTYEKVIENADKALYKAKQNGKNRVEEWVRNE